jgi:hemoglobin
MSALDPAQQSTETIFEQVGHGDDRELRDAVLSCIEFGTEVAKVNSNARSDAELHPQREMPQWHW